MKNKNHKKQTKYELGHNIRTKNLGRIITMKYTDIKTGEVFEEEKNLNYDLVGFIKE